MAKQKNSFDPIAGLARLNPNFMGVRYDREQYEYEKIIGRRRENGATKLKRLTGRHRSIIGLHLRCLSNADISLITGYSEAWISTLLSDPLSQVYIQEHIAGADKELEALAPLAVDAVRQGLQSASEGMRLKAADRFFRATGRFNDDPNKGKETAEDVIARALDAISQQAGAISELSRPVRSRQIEAHVQDVPYEEVKVNGHSSDSVE